jgi:hypothetical protein
MSGSGRHVVSLLAVVALVVVVVSSCTGDGDSTTARRSESSESSHFAVAALTFTGDPGLEGTATDAEVTCNFPDVGGLRISIFAQAADSTSSYRIALGPDDVFVQVDSGADTTFRERNFEGAGVSRFDAGTGATVDARLAEAAPTTGVEPGSIGKITRVRGSVHCGDQTPGSSTVALTGDTPTGRYASSRLDPVIVECYFASSQVTVIGIAHAGPTKVLLMVSLSPDRIGVEEALGSAGQRYYSSSADASATLTTNGAHAKGDVTEKTTPDPHTLHVEGAATCVTPVRS